LQLPPKESRINNGQVFLNYPIVAMVISILMVIVGAVAMISLPVAQYPNITPPEIRVEATYNGADAETIEQSVEPRPSSSR